MNNLGKKLVLVVAGFFVIFLVTTIIVTQNQKKVEVSLETGGAEEIYYDFDNDIDYLPPEGEFTLITEDKDTGRRTTSGAKYTKKKANEYILDLSPSSNVEIKQADHKARGNVRGINTSASPITLATLLAQRGGGNSGGGGKPGGGGNSAFPSCLEEMNNRPALADYVIYLTNNSKVVSAMNPCGLSVNTIGLFIAKLELAEATGQAPSAPLPDTYTSQDPLEITLINGGAQTSEIVAAKYAHALFLEVRQIVPWRLAEYSSQDLALIFKYPDYFVANFILDHSPKVAWDVVSQYLDVSGLTTQASALDDMMKGVRDFRHGAKFYDSNGNLIYRDDVGMVTLDQMAEDQVSRFGCWSMSHYMIQLAIAMNIPGQLTGEQYGHGHATGVFASTDKVMAHGDDPYSALLGDTPSGEVFNTYDYWKRNVSKFAGKVRGYINARVHGYDKGREYPSHWVHLYYCGKPVSARRTSLDELYTVVIEGTTHSFATADQLDEFETRILSGTSSCTLYPADNPDA